MQSTIMAIPATEKQIVTVGGARAVLSLLAVPPLVAGLSGHGIAAAIGLGIGLTWISFLLVALFSRPGATLALPVIAAASFVVSIFALRFNSASFVVCTWASLIMFMMTIPRMHTVVPGETKRFRM